MKIVRSSRSIRSDENFRQRGLVSPVIKVGDEVVVSDDKNKRGTVLDVGDDGVCLVDWNPEEQNLGYIDVSKLEVVNDEQYSDSINAAEDDEEWELDDTEQEYDSAATSINSTKLPAIYKMISIPEGAVFVDFGGGKFDNCVEYIKDKGATLCVYDPYNRSAEHNKEVLRILRENGGADGAINSNVLNVIKEPEARSAVLRNIAKITKSGAPIYITVYEGTGKGNEGPTKSGYQLNRKTQDYLEEIQEVFPDAKRKGKLITAHNTGVTASTVITSSYEPSENLQIGDEVYWLEDGEVWRDAVGIITKIHKKNTNDGNAHVVYYIEWDNDDESDNIESYNLIRVDEADSMDDEDDIFESTSIEASTQYDKSMTKKWNGIEYMIHYTSIDDIPEGEEDEYGLDYDRRIYNRYAGQISPIHPYDDAQYTWAKFEDGQVKFIRGGKVVDTGAYWTFEEGDFEYPYEWCNSIIDSIIELLDDANKDVEPKMIHMSTDIEASSNDLSISNLKSQITNKVDEIMHRPEYFGDDDDMFTVSDYYAVDIEDVEYSNYVRVEVRAEVDFDHLMEIADELNKITRNYDSDAYFDAVEPGILEAFIDSAYITVNAADYVPDHDLEPNEPDIKERTIEALIEVVLDDDITLYEEGNGITWDWADQDYTFARTPDGGKEHRTDEYGIFISDYIDVVEKVDEIIGNDNRLPLVPGNYHLRGEIDLVYDVEMSYVPHMGRSEDEYYEDENSAEVYYNEDKSKILPGFEITRI